MEVTYSVVYADAVVAEDIPQLTKTVRMRVRAAIERKLMTAPETFGKPLRRSLRGYRKLRVGDYRVIFRIEQKQVNVFVIQHRRVVYDTAYKRL